MSVNVGAGRTVELLQELVRIDSVNPSLAPSGRGEGQIASFVAGVLDQAGIQATLQEAAPGRPNVIGRLRGTGGGRTLIFNAHLDTVALADMEDPLSARVEDGRLFGRGAWDTKGGLAAGLSALLYLREAGVSLAGDLVIVGAADEEYASIGSEALVKEIRGDGCVILEPSDLAVWVAHGGFVWSEVETEGVAAHGSLPDQGIDAIMKMGLVLARLDELSKSIRRDKAFYSSLAHETIHPSVHASIIEGGRGLSTYPDRCLLQLERRMIPTETVEEVEAELEEILGLLAAEDAEFRAKKRVTLIRQPWQAVEGPLLDALEGACTLELGNPPRRSSGLMWTDAAIMQEAGIPTVIFGPKGEGKHALTEYVEIDSVVTCARILARTALDFCN